MLSEFDLGVVANSLREAYAIAYRSRFEVPNYLPSSRHDRTWLEVARLCVEQGFEPDLHVRALFNSGVDPYVKHLLGPKAVARTAHFIERHKLDEEILMRSQLAALRGRLACGVSAYDSLSNSCENFTPAFRYAACVVFGFEELAAHYAESARIDMALNSKRKELAEKLMGVDLNEHNDS